MKALPNGKQVGVLEYQREFYGRSRRLVVVYNPEQAKWNGENLAKKLAKEVAAVHAFFEKRLNTKKWRTGGTVRKKIEKMVPKKGHWHFLKCDMREEGGKVEYTLEVDEITLANYVATLGKSYLITNHPTKALEDLAWLFRQQVTVERAFTYLKSPDLSRARPIFHRKDTSIRGHLFTCALGLLLLTILAREVRKTRPE